MKKRYEVLFEKAIELFEAGRNNEAMDAIEKVIQINPNQIEGWLLKGNILYNLRLYDEAMMVFEKIIKINPSCVEAWRKKGIILIKFNQYDKAIDIFEKAIQINSNDDDLWFYKGISFATIKQYDKAISAFDKSIKINPNFAITWDSKGNALADLGQYDDAIKAYEKALEIDSTDETWVNKGVALYFLGQNEKALEAFEKATIINSNHVRALTNRGIVLANLGQYDEAIEAFEKALKIDPNFGQAWFNKGSLLADLGQYDDAIKAYEKAINIDTNYVKAWGGKGNALADLGQYDEAIEAFEEVIKRIPETDPDYAKILTGKGLSLYSLGLKKEAIKAYEKAINIDANYMEALINKGIVLADIGQYDEAIEAFEKALKIDPKYAKIWYCKGSIYFLAGNEKEGKKCYAKTINSLKQVKVTREILKKLQDLLELMCKEGDYNLAWEFNHTIIKKIVELKEKNFFQLQKLAYFYLTLAQNPRCKDKEKFLTLSLEFSKKICAYHISAQVEYELGKIKETIDERKAIRHYENAIEYSEKLRRWVPGIFVRSSFMSLFWKYYEKLCILYLNVNKYKEALLCREKMASRTMIDYLGNSIYSWTEKNSSESIAKKIQRYISNWQDAHANLEEAIQKNTSKQEEYRKDLIKNEQEWINFIEGLKNSNPELCYFFSITPPKYQTATDKLKKNEIIVEYFYERDDSSDNENKTTNINKIHIWIITPDRQEPVYIQRTFDPPFELKIEDLLEIIEHRHDTKVWKSKSKEIYDNLIKPIEEKISFTYTKFHKFWSFTYIRKLFLSSNSQVKPTIYFVPYQKLHCLPFGALFNGEKYLHEKYNIAQLPCLSIINFFKPSIGQEDFFVATVKENYADIGDNKYFKKSLKFKDIKTNDETVTTHAKKISKLFHRGNSIIFTDKDVKKDNIISKLSDVSKIQGKNKYLYFCLHGLIGNSVAQSAFIGSVDEKGQYEIKIDDMLQIGNLKSSLAFLLSCRTGMTESVGSSGDELTGFIQTMLIMGVNNVIAPLTEVTIEDGFKFAYIFFYYLRKTKGSAHLAFNLTQEKFSKKHPSCWAPYILVGKST